jgi:hypothetical protein
MSDLGPVFHALADRRRRTALAWLQEHHVVSLPDLAEIVAEDELGEDVTEISGERVREIYLSLYHTHVPLLTDAKLVRYDQEEDLVSRTEETAALLASVRDSVDRVMRNG